MAAIDEAAVKTNTNVRIYGSPDDALFIGPPGSTLPIEPTEAPGALFVPIGWLSEDGVPLNVSANVEKYPGHQGGAVMRTKVTGSEKNLSFTAEEESPVVTQLFFDHGTPTATPGGNARIDLPEAIGTVRVSAIAYFRDGGLDGPRKMICIPVLEITDRESVPHSGSAVSAYGMTGEIIGAGAYILTDAAAYVEALPPTGA